MNEIQDMLEAFQTHYGGLKYTSSQRMELIDKYRWMRPGYKVAVYDAVVSTHPMSLRSLPDIAVIESAMVSLGRPEVYEAQPPLIEDKTDVVHDSVKDALNARAKVDGELNHEERQRVRVRVARGHATVAEVFWMKVIDEYGGDWRRAYRGTA